MHGRPMDQELRWLPIVARVAAAFSTAWRWRRVPIWPARGPDSQRNGNLAGKPLASPIEAHLTLQLTLDQALHHTRAEALVRGWCHRRAARLGPAQGEPLARGARPADVQTAVRH